MPLDTQTTPAAPATTSAAPKATPAATGPSATDKSFSGDAEASRPRGEPSAAAKGWAAGLLGSALQEAAPSEKSPAQAPAAQKDDKAPSGAELSDDDRYYEACFGTDRALLLQLASSKDVTILKALVQNPATPASALEALAKRGDRALVGGIASHRNTPAPVLEELTRSKVPTIATVARDALARKGKLQELAAQEKQIAQQPALLDKMSAADRLELAFETQDPALLARLAKDADLHGTILRNQFTPLDVRARIEAEQDEDALVVGEPENVQQIVRATNEDITPMGSVEPAAKGGPPAADNMIYMDTEKAAAES